MSLLASGRMYGSRNMHRDVIEIGDYISRKREPLMRKHDLRSVRYSLRPRYKGGKPE